MTGNKQTILTYQPFTYQPYSFTVESPLETSKSENDSRGVQRRLRILVPKTTAWDPGQVQRMMTQFFAVTVPLTLGIEMTANELAWYIYIHKHQVTSLCQTIYALYPLADIVIDVEIQPRFGYYAFHFHASVPYIHPFKNADELPDFDPLITLLNTAEQLRSGEQVIYESVLLPPDPRVLELGQQLFNERIDSSAYEDNATQLRILYDKINGPLKAAQLVVKIKANTPIRAQHLMASLWPAMATFAQNGGNALVTPHRDSFQVVLSPAEMAALWHLPTEVCQYIAGISWAQAINTPLPAPLKVQKRGVILGMHTFRGQTLPVRLTYQDRDAHVTIIGTTGMGKTNLMHHMIHQDLEAKKALAVIDPHGDLYKDILQCSIPADQVEDFIIFNTEDPDSLPSLNPLDVPPGVSPSKVARQALDLIKKINAEDWPGAQTERYFAAALRALVEYPGATLRDIPIFLTDKTFRTFVLTHVADDQVRQTWQAYDRLNFGSQAKITEPILNRLDRFYSDPLLAQIICQPGSPDFRAIIDNQKNFLANLVALQEEREANTLGSLLVSKFQFAAMSRGDMSKAERLQKPFYLYVDELQRFTTTSLPILYAESRKFAISFTGAFQTSAQLPSEDLRGITSGVGVLITFGTTREDAKALAPFLDDQISARDLVSLNKYTPIVSMRLHGQSLPDFPIQSLPPLQPKPDAEQTIARIRAHNRDLNGHPAETKNSKAVGPPDPMRDDNDDPETAFFAG